VDRKIINRRFREGNILSSVYTIAHWLYFLNIRKRRK